jgi:hypothetical protein
VEDHRGAGLDAGQEAPLLQAVHPHRLPARPGQPGQGVGEQGALAAGGDQEDSALDGGVHGHQCSPAHPHAEADRHRQLVFSILPDPQSRHER